MIRIRHLAALALATVATTPAAGQLGVLERDIAGLQELMAAGQATSVEITRAYLARIEAYDRQGPSLRAMVWMNPAALAEAEALDREREETGARGPLHGIPIILKDNYDTVGMPTAAGTLALAANVAPDDAFQVTRLRAAGAVILGKANMHELASGITTISSLGGQTLNPYDLTRNPGGSSGGTAAAVAASFAAVGWGSDTCGSIRIPAAQNDLVGLRPTKGLSSIDGIIPLAHTQDVGGPLARTVRDLALALDATVGPDAADPATSILDGRDVPVFLDALDPDALRGARIGILEEYFGSAPEEAAADALVRAAIDSMVAFGADTVTVEIEDLDELIRGSGVIGYETKWDLMDYLAANPDAPVSSLGEMLDRGLVHEELLPRMRSRNAPEERESEAYRTALSRRGPLREAVERTLNLHSLDAIVFPTVRTVPAVIGDPQRGSSCSLGANTGLPSISVPVGFTSGGLPIGMELMARTLEDARLVALAYAFEQRTDHRRPPASTPALEAGQGPTPRTLALTPGLPGGLVEADDGIEVDHRLVLIPTTNRVDFDLTVSGVSADELLGVALRRPGPEGSWQVSHLLVPAGRSEARGAFVLTAQQREALDGGDMHLIVLTRARPFGAWIARLVDGPR